MFLHSFYDIRESCPALIIWVFHHWPNVTSATMPRVQVASPAVLVEICQRPWDKRWVKVRRPCKPCNVRVSICNNNNNNTFSSSHYYYHYYHHHYHHQHYNSYSYIYSEYRRQNASSASCTADDRRTAEVGRNKCFGAPTWRYPDMSQGLNSLYWGWSSHL